MALSGVSEASFLQRVPFFFGSVPVKTHIEQVIPGDWCSVTVQKRGSNGEVLDEPFSFIMENSTGDLYGIQSPSGAPSRFFTSVKCAFIATGVLLYIPLMMAWRPINCVADIVETFLASPKLLADEYANKGLFVAMCNRVTADLSAVMESLARNVSKLVLTVLYAFPLLFAACYGVILPYEGMKQISIIESALHGNATYRSDIRYQRGSWLSTTLIEDFKAARTGQVFFLAYCMQKRGNIEEEVKGERRFTLITPTS